MSYIVQTEQATPSTPASGKNSWFFDTNGNPAWVDDAGILRYLAPVLLTPQSLSGTAINFTVPTSARKIWLSVSGLSGNGTSIPIIQLGTGSGVETSSYSGAAFNVTNSGTAAVNNLSTGFQIFSNLAANVIHGAFELTLINSSTNLWGLQGCYGMTNTATGMFTGGTKALAAAITTVRLTFVNGTDTFDAGSAGGSYM